MRPLHEPRQGQATQPTQQPARPWSDARSGEARTCEGLRWERKKQSVLKAGLGCAARVASCVHTRSLMAGLMSRVSA